MTIYDAVEIAMRNGICITLPEFCGQTKIRPTDTVHNCIVSQWDGSGPSKTGWQPSGKDLLRNDWLVTD